MSFEIIRSNPATQEDKLAIAAPLHTHNEQTAPPGNYEDLALCIRDAEGNTIGGLWGRFNFDWLYVDYLAVPPQLRGTGIGSSLLKQAEQLAIERNCVGLWLDTFSFQALPFYEKLGYKVFGHLDDYPRGYSRYFLQKRF